MLELLKGARRGLSVICTISWVANYSLILARISVQNKKKTGGVRVRVRGLGLGIGIGLAVSVLFFLRNTPPPPPKKKKVEK